MGRRKRYLKQKVHEYPGLAFPGFDGLEGYRGRWREEVFGGREALHLELGAGRGLFVSTLAQLLPAVGFLALEIKADRCTRIAAHLAAAELENARVLCGRQEGLGLVLGPGEVDRLWMNFPDPWPKTRYAGRRMMHRERLRLLRSIAVKDAWFHLRTDSRALFEWSQGQLARSGWQRGDATGDAIASLARDVCTEYEQDFRDQGREVYYLDMRAAD